MDTIISPFANRRSIRSYTSKKVSPSDITKILTAASWAPSGNNLQPWRFSVVMNDEQLLKKLSSLTVYHSWVQTAPCLIAVFLDKKVIDPNIQGIYLKHVQAVGAAIQNMLLAAHELGLGSCWIGEILKNEDQVKELVGAADDLELMAVISVGYPNKTSTSRRRDILENIVSWL
jgi:nitroreductase